MGDYPRDPTRRYLHMPMWTPTTITLALMVCALLVAMAYLAVEPRR